MTYHVTVTNVTRGWTMTATQGVDVDVDDVSLSSVLTAPLRIRWGFTDGMAPGPMDPVRVTFGLWSRSLTREPVTDLGDIIAVDVRWGTTGPYLYRFEGGRITDAPTELHPDDPWSVRTSVEVTDLLADAGSKFPTFPFGSGWGVPRASWQTRFALIGQELGRSIGLPASLATYAATGPQLRLQLFGDSATTLMRRLINSWAPNLVHHTVVSRVTPTAAYPAGYSWAEQLDRPFGGDLPDVPLRVDPATTAKYLVVPASRREASAVASPLQFAFIGGRVTLMSTPGGSPVRHPSLPARAIRIPTTLTRRREHMVNTVRLKGFNQSMQALGTPNYAKSATYETTNAPDVAARGNIAREIDTDLVFREYATDDTVLTPLKALVADQAASYLADASVLASNRAYGSLDVFPDLMADAEAAALLPYLAPQPPGILDGRVLRHVTVWGADDDVSARDVVPGGFIVAGELVIDGGRLRYNLTTTPGRPTYLSSVWSTITLGEFSAKALALSTVATLDPSIRVADLDLTGA